MSSYKLSVQYKTRIVNNCPLKTLQLPKFIGIFCNQILNKRKDRQIGNQFSLKIVHISKPLKAEYQEYNINSASLNSLYNGLIFRVGQKEIKNRKIRSKLPVLIQINLNNGKLYGDRCRHGAHKDSISKRD